MISHSPVPRRPLPTLRALAAIAILMAIARPVSAAAPEPADSGSVQVDVPPTKEAAGLLRLGAGMTEKGDYSTAEIAYRQILNRGDFPMSDQKAALLALAHMFRKAGALTKAAAIYEKFLQQFPDDVRVPDAYLDLGRTLREVGAYELAISRFYNVINTTLKLPSQGFDHYTLLAKTAQFEIAQTYYDEGNFDEAGRFFTRVRLLDLAPADRARAQFMAGCAEVRAGELDQAVQTLRTYLDQWPDDENVPEARYELATTLDDLKRPQEALAATLALLHAEHGRIATDPRRWNYWQRRTGNQLANRFFQNGDALDALGIYAGLVDLAPEASWRLPILYQTALCYERLYQVDRARDAYQQIVAAAKAAGAEPSSDVAELADMAAWRLQHLEWRDGINRQLTKFLSPDTVGSVPASAKAPASPSPARQPAS